MGAGLITLARATRAVAQSSWPTRTIRLVAPFAAGGGTDILARVLSQQLHEILHQACIVVNIDGAGGTVGATEVATAAPDGYTLLVGTPGTIEVNPLTHSLRYDPQKDLAPISLVTESAAVLVANRDFPPNTVQELIAYARQRPGEVNFGSAGPGSFSHISGEMFDYLAHVNMTHVPYRGTSAALADLLAGRVQLLFENMPPVMGDIQNGAVKAIAIGSATRSSFFPKLSTIAESGVPDYESTSFMGLLAPAKTPRPIIDRLQQAIVDGLHDPETATRLHALGVELNGSTPEQFAAFIARGIALTAKVVEAAHMRQS
jgi:tripartite-type tricarboxylate transporter receptor subunit TctC